MKNRKLFAIITLVAFMLTMMPLMAFAGDNETTPVVPNITASGSSISVDKSTAKVFSESKLGASADKDKIEALEFILDMDGKVADNNQKVIVFAERNGSMSDTDTIFAAQPRANATLDNKGYLVLTPEKAAEETLYVASNTAGTVTLKAYLVKLPSGFGDVDSNIARIYNGSNEIIKAAFVGNGCTGKINAANSDIAFETTINGTPVTDNGSATGVAANNGVDTFKLNVKVTKGTSKLVGEKVTVSIDKTGATVNEEEKTTSATGKAEFKISATKAGTYNVTVECGNHSETYALTFGNTGVDKLNITYTTQGTIATDNDTTTAVMLAAYDVNGNFLNPADLFKDEKGKAFKSTDSIGNFVAKVESAPADSSKEDEELTFRYDTTVADSIYITFTPDAAGEYVIKVYNKNTGAAVRTTIKAAEFGTADHATLSYASAVYSLGEKTPAGIVDLYDQNGVKKSVKSGKQFSYSGLGVAVFDPANGNVTFKADNDYAGKEVLVSVVVNNKFSASTTLTIAAEPASLNFTDATAEVGSEASAKLQVVDVNGKASAISNPNAYEVTVQSAIITEKPEGATASVDADAIANNSETFLKKGTSTVKIASNKEGTVKANVVVKLVAKQDVIRDGITYNAEDVKDANGKVTKKANPYTFYLSGVATATFGAKAPEKGTGDTVTFIIGNTTFVANGATKAADVAPYVANGRTFIPVRAFAEATGAKVEYDAATQVITITGEGLSAQMTIGSNILTVNGQTTVMDTAAAVTAEGRTVLPVRFAGQALGYGFEVAYGANGAVSSVTMFK